MLRLPGFDVDFARAVQGDAGRVGQSRVAARDQGRVPAPRREDEDVVATKVGDVEVARAVQGDAVRGAGARDRDRGDRRHVPAGPRREDEDVAGAKVGDVDVARAVQGDEIGRAHV